MDVLVVHVVGEVVVGDKEGEVDVDHLLKKKIITTMARITRS